MDDIMCDEDMLVETRLTGLRDVLRVNCSGLVPDGLVPAFAVGYADADRIVAGYVIPSKVDDGLVLDVYGFIDGETRVVAQVSVRRS